MAKKQLKIKVDTINGLNKPEGTIKQLDSVLFNVAITEAGEKKDLTSQQVKLFARKSDGKIVEQTTGISITDATNGQLTIDLLNAAVQTPGYVYFELEISDNSGTISTANFIYKVISKVGSDKAIESTNEVATLKKIEEYVAQAKVELQNFKKLQTEMIKTNEVINNKEALREEAEVKRAEAEGVREEKIKEIGARVANVENKIQKEVPINKTTFFKTNHINLVDTTKAVEGSLNSSSGAVEDRASSSVSDFIEVREGEYYTSNTNWNYVFYNANREYVSGGDGYFNTKQIPSGVKFVRVGFSTSNLGKVMFVKGNQLPDNYVSYDDYDEVYIKDGFLLKTIKNEIESSLINIDNIKEFEVEHINLIDISKSTRGFINKENGYITDNSNSLTSDFIEVCEGEYYTSNVDYDCAYYDKNKKFISGVANPFKTKQIPSGVKFVRVSFSKTINSMFCKGKILKDFVNYNNILVKLINATFKFDYNNLAFLSKDHINLVDTTKAVEGSLNSSSGAVEDRASSSVSDFIEVREGEYYTSNTNWNYAFYNANREYISGGDSYFNTKQIPSGVKFVRVGFSSSNLGKVMFVKGNQLPDNYVSYDDYEIKINDNKIINTISKTTHLEGLTWNVLGDSITYGLNCTKPYWYQISKEYGINVNCYGISGSTIGDYGNPSTNPMVNRFSDMADADIITVFGGTNDCGDIRLLGTMEDRNKNTFYGACHILYSGLIKKYPNKRIGVITPCQRGKNDQYLQNFVDAAIEVANYYSIPVLDLYRSGGLTKNVPEVFETQMDEELLHPNNIGHGVLARRIINFLLSL